MAHKEFEQWSNDELTSTLDDEADLNEIVAESLGRGGSGGGAAAANELEKEEPDELEPTSATLYEDPVDKISKISIQPFPNARYKVQKERQERQWQDRNVNDLKLMRQEIAQMPDDKEKLNRLQEDKKRYEEIIATIEPDPDYIDGRPRTLWKRLYRSLDYYKQRLDDTESDLKRLREMGIH